tara:strand:+ start:218 stop:751 length:534 start_codon:yes stop_codon:yes gene_type:complete
MKEIQVITGCMFSGKTTELITRLKCAKGDSLLIKPLVDNRNSGNRVFTHSGIVENAIKVRHLSDVFDQLKNINVIGIDEAQFFPGSIIQDLLHLNSKKIKIIIAGLEKDYLNQPFDVMTDIISIADKITRLYANCSCGEKATCSYRKNTNSKQQLLIGDKNFYEALCDTCFSNRQPF